MRYFHGRLAVSISHVLTSHVVWRIPVGVTYDPQPHVCGVVRGRSCVVMASMMVTAAGVTLFIALWLAYRLGNIY